MAKPDKAFWDRSALVLWDQLNKECGFLVPGVFPIIEQGAAAFLSAGLKAAYDKGRKDGK